MKYQFFIHSSVTPRKIAYLCSCKSCSSTVPADYGDRLSFQRITSKTEYAFVDMTTFTSFVTSSDRNCPRISEQLALATEGTVLNIKIAHCKTELWGRSHDGSLDVIRPSFPFLCQASPSATVPGGDAAAMRKQPTS